MIRNIIFDIGGVLAGFDWTSYIRKYGFDPEKEAALTGALVGGPYWKEFDRGVMSMDELKKCFCSLVPEEYREDLLMVFQNAGGCVYRLDHAKPWIATLKEHGYRTYYLSNYSAWMIEQTKEALDFLPLLDGGIFSCEVKQIKPDEGIYRSLLSRYPEILPEESVFLDDTAVNVEAARRLGFHGIVVQNKEQTELELARLLAR